MQRMSPASSESLQSGTPSSDFPLEKVPSYFTADDSEDSSNMRPMRAYSVGSRSDTSSTGKSLSGKNRLEAVQESVRIRAMSVGSRHPRKVNGNNGVVTPGSSGFFSTGNSGKSGSSVTLSSSWSGSTGRWPPLRYSSSTATGGAVNCTPSGLPTNFTSHGHATDESTTDSDLMELDFTRNKKNRKRSLPGPNGVFSSSISPSMSKVSPCAKGFSGSGNGSDTPDTPDAPKSFLSASPSQEGFSCPNQKKYVSSAPISIQKGFKLGPPSCAAVPTSCGGSGDVVSGVGGFKDTSGVSLLSKMTGMSTSKLKQLDQEGAYLDMDFNPQKRVEQNVLAPRKSVVSATTGFSRDYLLMNGKSSELGGDKGGASTVSTNGPLLSRSISSSSNISNISNNSNSSSGTSCVSVKSPQLSSAPTNNAASPVGVTSTTTSSSFPQPASPVLSGGGGVGLSRIEESPEKQDASKSLTKRLSSPSCGQDQVTYTTIEVMPPVKRTLSGDGGPKSPKNTSSSAKTCKGSVTYSQIDFVKST